MTWLTIGRRRVNASARGWEAIAGRTSWSGSRDGCRIARDDRSIEQLLQAVDEVLNGERLYKVFRIRLRQEQVDLGVGGEAGDEDETVGQMRAQLAGLEIEFIAAQLRHHDVANYGVVFVGLYLDEGLGAVVGDIDKEIRV